LQQSAGIRLTLHPIQAGKLIENGQLTNSVRRDYESIAADGLLEFAAEQPGGYQAPALAAQT
jgi:hypothetical protein